MIYRFDDFELDTDRFELRRSGDVLPVEPQVFALIELLVSNHHRLVTKDEINLRVWGGRVVSEAVVSSRIRSARRAIGDDGKTQRLIRTVHNRGFRFVGEPRLDESIAVDRAVIPARPEEPADQREPGPAAAAGRPSIAVLPFQMLGGDVRYETLADALAHDVIIELSRLHWLFVIARGSSFRFRGADVDLGHAADLLGVRYLLTGSIMVHEGRSIVTAELVQADDGRVLWADRLEGALDDLLGLRFTIATRIVAALETRIPANEANRAASLPTESLDAWSAYHRGLWHMYRFNAHDNEIAARMFDRAVSVDSGFARAHAGLSFTHFQNAFVGYSADPENDRKLARQYAERSLELDPFDPFANLTMGRADMLSGDLERSATWFDRSIELSPNFAFAIYNRALIDAIGGHGAESEASVTRAIALSPLDPLHYAMLSTRALSHLVRGDYETASMWAERGANAPNAHVLIFAIAAVANELAGKRQEAEHWAARVHSPKSGYTRETFFRSFPFRDEAMFAAAEAAFERLGL
jgi:TolB-like protein/Tfp pilus assembly protein PilF